MEHPWEEETVDTIAGWCLSQNFELKEGERIEEEGFIFIVRELDGRQLRYLEIKKNEEIKV